MAMKKAISILLLFTLPIILQAQIGKKIKRAATQTAENKAAQKTGQAVDKGIDKSIDAIGGIFKKKKSATTNEQEEETNNQSTATEDQQVIPQDSTANQFGVFRNFTFVPGNKVIFYDDFAKDASGDFPVNWGTGGSGEVVALSNETGNWLSMQRRSGYLPNLATDLPENYTIEFDLITNGYGTGKPSSKLYLAFTAKSAYTMGQAGSVADIELLLYKYFSVVRAANFGSEAKIKVGSVIDRQLPELINAKMHISIAVNKQRLRFWINEEKYVDAPSILQGNMSKHFIIQAMDILPEKGHFAAITNFRIAEAGEDLRSKLMKEGKFSTSGIFFNTNSAIVKKESFGVLKLIADMMKSDEKIKLDIVGHTDDVGDKNFNQSLSVKRAETVKNIMVNEFSIAGSRFLFSGKGESVPVDDNATEKGRANNRRVEFVKF
jgi:OmpA-OmpF porin, OOP family